MTFEGQEVMELDLKTEICYWSKEIQLELLYDNKSLI